MSPLPTRVSKKESLFESLQFKVLAVTIVLVVLVLAVISGVFIFSAQQKATEDIKRNGATFANISAPTIYTYFTQLYTNPESFRTFQTRVEAMLARNSDISQISLLSLNGRILFSTDEFDSGRYSGPARTITDDSTLDLLRVSSDTTSRSVVVNGQSVEEIIVPLQEAGGGHILSMRYLLTDESLSERMDEIYTSTAITSSILVLIVMLSAIYIGRKVEKPIIELTQAAEKIRGGDFDVRVVPRSKDEIGRLALSLNTMATQLKSSYENLEQKVHQRTEDLEKTQIKLLQSVKQHEALLTSIGDGVIATDATGNVNYINTAAQLLLHLTEEESIGKQYNTLWIVEDANKSEVEITEQPIYRALHDGVPISISDFYYARMTAVGEQIRFAVSTNVSPIKIDNQTVGIVAVFRDITHEKNVDRMKTEFISLASHQLRTPLSAIKWFSEMLLNGDAGMLSTEQKDFAKNISDSTDRMVELVSSLLNISRIESGRMIVDPRPTDLKELIGGIINDLKAKTEERQQTLIVSVHSDLPKINLDPRLIGQVYLNLLTNAVKYTPKNGEISVMVSVKGEDIISQVTDNGYGIPKKQQGRVFEKFFRAENISKVETDGTGLGLYLIKSIVESSGGKIWFESEEGKGTSFWFSIPLSGMKAKEGEVTIDM